MAAVANICRAASTVRQNPENSVLRGADLTWTAFVSETRHVAEEAGISKGTRTHVSRPLESRGLLNRAGHPTDGQLALIRLTDEGQERRSRRRRPKAQPPSGEQRLDVRLLAAEDAVLLTEGGELLQ